MNVRAERRFSGDPWKVLGLPRNADAHEIRGAFRRAAKKLHPDVNPSPDAAERMARLNWAYKTASEHARREGPRAYRGASHTAGPRGTRPRWYVRHRPPPAGGRLVAVSRRVTLSGLRGESATIEGLVVVRNAGTGPLEGEVRADPAWVIVSPKGFTLEPDASQMFRVSVPNRYCQDDVTQATLLFESNGGDERVILAIPPTNDVVLTLEPSVIDIGACAPGEARQARLRLTYRGQGLPRIAIQTDVPWIKLVPITLPRRTQYYRVLIDAPAESDEFRAVIGALAGGARATTTVRLRVVAPEAAPEPIADSA